MNDADRGLPARILRRAAAASTAAVVLAGLVACTPDSSDGPAEGTKTAAPEVVGDVPAELEDFYTQEVVWESCEGDFLCATVEVPLDYENPGKRSIELSVILAEAGGTPAGTVLVNPGGPGGSGYTTVRDSLEGITTDRLRREFNILGFDPRGVGRSTPVDCLSDEELDEARAEILDPSTEAGLEEARASAAEYADACAEASGELLGFVDTESAARDMDILRAVAGDPKLNYLGFSYGTFLGATYAELFPGRWAAWSWTEASIRPPATRRSPWDRRGRSRRPSAPMSRIAKLPPAARWKAPWMTACRRSVTSLPPLKPVRSAPPTDAW